VRGQRDELLPAVPDGRKAALGPIAGAPAARRLAADHRGAGGEISGGEAGSQIELTGHLPGSNAVKERTERTGTPDRSASAGERPAPASSRPAPCRRRTELPASTRASRGRSGVAPPHPPPPG